MTDVMEHDVNERAVIGANNPPEPTPFDLSREEIDGLFMEANNWLDGEAVTTQAQADAIAKIITDLRAAVNTADARRVTENKPFDTGKAEVQARYNPYIKEPNKAGLGGGKAYLAIETCKKAIAPFLKRQDDQKKAEAELARREAEEKQKAAHEAFLTSDSANLAERQNAERLATEAKDLAAYANRAEKDRGVVRGGGRAITLRTVYSAEITNETDFARFVWANHKTDLSQFLEGLADRLVKAGRREIPGVAVLTNQVPV